MRIRESIMLRGAMMLMMALAVGAARSQTTSTGSIAGTVKDASGAVIPGVQVQAASPALIDKVRTTTTDDHGQYKIVDLRPGTYSVTFSIAGFGTSQVAGLELNAGVTLPIDTAMKPSSSQEMTVTSGSTPMVDVQNTITQNVLTQQALEELPQAGTIQGFQSLTLGATISSTGVPDVGGNKGEQTADISIHDSRAVDGRLMIDGMSFASGLTAGGMGQRSIVVNKISTQELTVLTGTGGSDQETSGANINIVPREGGNTYHGFFMGTGASRALQASNLTPALQARGLTSAQNIIHVYDLGLGFGGPIIRDKLWFWTGIGDWASLEYAPGNYFNSTQSTLFYTPDLTRPAYTNTWNYAADMRLNWQASKRNKFSLSQTAEDFCLCYARVDLNNQAPEAANNNHNKGSYLTQVTWSNTLTAKLVVAAGYTAALAPGRVNELADGVAKTDVPITLQNTGYQYHAFLGLGQTAYGHPVYDEMNGFAHVFYTSGAHALKVGYTWQWNNENYDNDINALPGIGPVSYIFNQATGAPKPTPVSLTEYASPHHSISRSWVTAFYAEDQWTLKKLTLTFGARLDSVKGYAPAQTAPATIFTPSINFPELDNIPNWHDISPRVGAAYDLFGNGKTAIKGAFGRYVVGDYTTTTVANNPAEAIVTSATRTWSDANGNYVPDCNLTLTTANGECGALSNNGFGTVVVNTTYDPAVLAGWWVRPYNWEGDIQIQQQLRPGMGITAAYYRTWYGNFNVTQNTAVPSNQYGTYCITGPTDSRVSALTGKQVCGFHDVNPAYFGKVSNRVTAASNFGGQSEVYNGVDVSMNWRFGHGGLLIGGVSFGQTVNDDCAIAKNSPNVTATMANSYGTVVSNTTTPSDFCHVETPWATGSQAKVAVNYPLPFHVRGLRGLQSSVTYQNVGGFPYNTSYVASNTQIATSLGRNLSSCATSPCSTTVTLTNALYAPFSVAESRLNQLDLRFSKVYELGRFSVKGMFDIYNIGNSSTILSENATYSASTTYLRPTAILGPRMFKFGMNVKF